MRTGAFAVIAGLAMVFGTCAGPVSAGGADDTLSSAAAEMARTFVPERRIVQGEVADVDDTTDPATVYVTLGPADGVWPDRMLDIVTRGEPIAVDGRTVGDREHLLGTARVTRVQSEHLCVARLTPTAAASRVRRGNVAYLKPPPGAVAVCAFTRPDSGASPLGREFADRLGMSLTATGRFTVLERERLEMLLDQMRLDPADILDPALAANLAERLGVAGVVIGSLTRDTTAYVFAGRLIDIGTGIQYTPCTVTCRRSAELDTLYERAPSSPPDRPGKGPLVPPPDARARLFVDIPAQPAPFTPSPWERTQLSVGGTRVDRAFSIRVDPEKTPNGSVAFKLDARYRRARVTLGIEDGFSSFRPHECRVLLTGDGRELEARTLRRGELLGLEADVRGVDTLRIEIRELKADSRLSTEVWAGECWVW